MSEFVEFSYLPTNEAIQARTYGLVYGLDTDQTKALENWR